MRPEDRRDMSGRREQTQQLGKTSPSNRMSHGFRSKARAEARREDAGQLSEALIGGLRASGAIAEAASGLADAILLLHAIRERKRHIYLESGPEPEYDPFDEILIRNGFYAGAPRSVWGPKLERALARHDAKEENAPPDVVKAARCLVRNLQELRKLEEYERKATSRRNRLIMRLDYLVTEARRSA